MRRISRYLGLSLMGAALASMVGVGLAGEGPGRYNDFTFARVIYNSGDGFFRRFERWAVDFPASDYNMIRMLRLQTTLRINEPQAIELTDPALFEIPFLYILEVGSLEWNQAEAKQLREYLLRGGFMMVDDFHGSYQWAVWESQIKKVFPNRSIEEIPPDHPVFHCYYDFDEYPVVPGTGAIRRGRIYEQDGEMYGQRCRGIFDDRGRLIVLINWNTDIGDGWEWAAEGYAYPREYSEIAYRLGVNYAMYAMTH